MSTPTNSVTASEAAPPRRRPPTSALIAGVALAIVAILLALGADGGPLSVPKAILLGAVEGITEFLPVSSTGHLLVTQRLVGLGTSELEVAADTYAIAIQVGAIVAVVAVYRLRIAQLALGVVGRSDDGRRLLARLLLAFAPAAVIGLALDDVIKDRLFGPWPIVVAWAVGGAALLVWRPKGGSMTLDALTVRAAVIIGFAQALALWPGVSRSLVTLVAALLVGCEIGAAVEFSFLLGLATLTAATALDLAQDGGELLDEFGWRTPVLGAIVAFVTALAAVRWLVAYLRTRPLTIFGWYRLAIAAATAVLIATNAI